MIRTIQEIEGDIRQLSPEDRVTLCARLAELSAAEWDRQLEADVAAGRLDWLADEARQDVKSGRCTDRLKFANRIVKDNFPA